MTKILIEAEQMVLDGYRVETNGDVDASGGQLIKLSGSTGTASLDFSVEQAGTYDLTAWYYDESDGNSPVTVQVGSKSESWTFNEDTDSGRASKGNRRSRVIKGVELARARIRLKVTGNVESGENSRFDAFRVSAIDGRLYWRRFYRQRSYWRRFYLERSRKCAGVDGCWQAFRLKQSRWTLNGYHVEAKDE